VDSVDAELLGPEEVHVLVELLVDGTDDDTRGCQKKKKKKKKKSSVRRRVFLQL